MVVTFVFGHFWIKNKKKDMHFHLGLLNVSDRCYFMILIDTYQGEIET